MFSYHKYSFYGMITFIKQACKASRENEENTRRVEAQTPPHLHDVLLEKDWHVSVRKSSSMIFDRASLQGGGIHHPPPPFANTDEFGKGLILFKALPFQLKMHA